MLSLSIYLSTCIYLSIYLSIYIFIYIHIYQMDCVCQRYHKECSTHSKCVDDCYNCWKNSKLKSFVRPLVSWIIPIVRQSKTDLIHKQVMRSLRHGGSHFVIKWLPPWRKGRITCLWIVAKWLAPNVYIYIYVYITCSNMFYRRNTESMKEQFMKRGWKMSHIHYLNTVSAPLSSLK